MVIVNDSKGMTYERYVCLSVNAQSHTHICVCV